MRIEKVKSVDELIEGEQYLVRLSVRGDSFWKVMFVINGVLTDHPDGGDLQFTFNLAREITGDQVYKLPK